jgi:hypothetical protein
LEEYRAEKRYNNTLFDNDAVARTRQKNLEYLSGKRRQIVQESIEELPIPGIDVDFPDSASSVTDASQ